MADAVQKVRSAPGVNTGKENTGGTMKKLSTGSAEGQGAAEGAHYGKARRQTQREQSYK